MDETGVDGFKFDAGEAQFVPQVATSWALDYATLWARLAARLGDAGARLVTLRSVTLLQRPLHLTLSLLSPGLHHLALDRVALRQAECLGDALVAHRVPVLTQKSDSSTGLSTQAEANLCPSCGAQPIM